MTNKSAWQSANGKIILFGEHAVVYGVEAVAAAIPNMLRARVEPVGGPSRIEIPNWGVSVAAISPASDNVLHRMLGLIVKELAVPLEGFAIEVESDVPPASGLGASAAVAVAMTKALAAFHTIKLSLSDVNRIAYKCEQLAHGTPSGLDNTLATYGGVLRFKREGSEFRFSELSLETPIELLVALSGKKGYTAETVARVRAAKQAEPEKIGAIFTSMAQISTEGIEALMASDEAKLAALFSRNQQCLRSLQVSCEEIEQVLTIAESSGAKSGKLTGSGDGGAVILLPGEAIEPIETALHRAGFSTLRAYLA